MKIFKMINLWIKSKIDFILKVNTHKIRTTDRHFFIKRRLLKQLEAGPKSTFCLETIMKEEGFRTPVIMRRALQELVTSGLLTLRTDKSGKYLIYERAEPKK